MKDTFTIKELAAILVRRGKMVLVFAVVFALLLGGWQGLQLIEAANSPKNTPAQIEARYLKALESYQEEKTILEKQIADTQKQLDNQLAYNKESLLMKLDPLNTAVTRIFLMVSGLNNEELNQLFLTDTMAVDYAINQIQKQYSLYWDTLSLQQALADTPLSNVQEKYIREIASVSTISSNGTYMSIVVSAETEEASQQTAQAILNAILAYQPTVVENSFTHHLSLVSQATKIEIQEGLESAQNSNLGKVKTYQANLEKLENTLKDLKAPVCDEIPSAGTILKGTVKYLVLGAALGVVLSVVWIMLSYLFRSRPELSRHLAQALCVPMLGAASAQKGLFGRLANRILGERVWKDDNQALEYLTASAVAHLPENATVALLSTLPIPQESPEAQAVLEAFGKKGFHVCFAEDANRNPQAVRAVQECNCVILAERCGVSNWNAIQETVTLAENLETPVKGLLLI